jgi:hypothetical protein
VLQARPFTSVDPGRMSRAELFRGDAPGARRARTGTPNPSHPRRDRIGPMTDRPTSSVAGLSLIAAISLLAADCGYR